MLGRSLNQLRIGVTRGLLEKVPVEEQRAVFAWYHQEAAWRAAEKADAEMRRVARPRETLGAEGAAYVPRPNVPGWPLPLRAPRLEFHETGASDQE